MTRRAVVALVAAALVSGAVLPTPWATEVAHARVASTESSQVAVMVAEVTGVLGPGARGATGGPTDELRVRLLVENRGEDRVDNVRLVTEIHDAVTSVSMLTRALAGERVGPPLHVHDLAIRDGTLAVDDVAGIDERFSLRDSNRPDLDTGVYPVRFAVVRGTDVVAETTTAVVWLDERVDNPLQVAMVWPFEASPWRGVGGTYARGIGRELTPGSRLERLLAALERHPEPQVVFAPAAHLIEDIRDRSDGFTVMERQEDGTAEPRSIEQDAAPAVRATTTLRRLRDVAASLRFQPVSGSYADADLSALRRAGSPASDLAAEAAVEGRRRLQLLLGRDVDAAAHLLWGPIDPAVLDLLPGEIVVLPSHAVVDARREIGEHGAVRVLRSPSGRFLTGLVADPDVTAALEFPERDRGTEAVQRIIAVTALRYLAAPQVEGRGLLILPPQDFDPTAELADRLLATLTTTPWFEPTGISNVASGSSVDPAPLELIPSTTGALPDSFASALSAATTELTAARSGLQEGAGLASGRSFGELRDALMRASSRSLRGAGQGRAEALVADVAREVDETFGEIEIGTGAVTLTSTSGQIPITLQRTEGGPIQLQVEVASQGRLLWPGGRRSEPVVLHEGEAQTVSFATEALGAGTFPVTVRVTDPSGQHVLATADLSVRSTAISRPALGATGALVLVLLLVGAVRRRRRPRRALELVG